MFRGPPGPAAMMSAKSLAPLQPRTPLAFSLYCLLFIALPRSMRADSTSGFRGVQILMNSNLNETRSLNGSPNFGEIASSTSRRSVKYTNRRFLDGEMCTKFDISIFQGPGSPLPNGIPTFSVQIFNLCTVGCPISDVHVACGWFASAKLVNPRVFRRVKFNDCLVNDGNPIPYGESITFQYANSFAYQLRVETAVTWLWERSKSPASMLSSDEIVLRTQYTNRRILASNMCTNKDISVFQGRDTSSGIPQYIVQISNTCLSDCAPSDIHVYCGWFASATLVNPNTFKRNAFNDCLVNGGNPLRHGDIIRVSMKLEVMAGPGLCPCFLPFGLSQLGDASKIKDLSIDNDPKLRWIRENSHLYNLFM